MKPLRHEAHTHARLVAAPSWMRTFCKLGFQRRRVALREWLRALPKLGCFPHE